MIRILEPVKGEPTAKLDEAVVPEHQDKVEDSQTDTAWGKEHDSRRKLDSLVEEIAKLRKDLTSGQRSMQSIQGRLTSGIFKFDLKKYNEMELEWAEIHEAMAAARESEGYHTIVATRENGRLIEGDTLKLEVYEREIEQR